MFIIIVLQLATLISMTAFNKRKKQKLREVTL